MSQKIQREFEFERATKRTYRFKEVGNNTAIGTLYVQQFVFDEKPDKLTVTVEFSNHVKKEMLEV